MVFNLVCVLEWEVWRGCFGLDRYRVQVISKESLGFFYWKEIILWCGRVEERAVVQFVTRIMVFCSGWLAFRRG